VRQPFCGKGRMKGNLTMSVKRKSIFHILVIMIVSLIAIMITLISSNPIYHVIGLWSIAIVAVIICNLDFLHPYFWLSSFFVLYSSAYSIILIQGFQSNTGYSYENTLFSIIALTTALITIGPKRNTIVDTINNDFVITDAVNHEINRKLLRIILIILILILIISVIILSRLGVQRKTEFVNNGYISFRIATYTARFISLFCTIYIVNSSKNSKLGLVVLFSGLSTLFFSLFTAERDGIFRFLLVIVCALFATNRIERKKLPFVLALGVVLVVTISYLKYFFISGEVRTGYLENSLLYNFLNSDFAAAGENMQVLLNNPWTKSYLDFSLLFTDLISPFTFGVNSFNVGVWFNNTFYFGESSRAFTLIGQGYVMGGYFGVMLLFSILGIMIRIIYNKAVNDTNWLSIYIFFIATVASSFRGTLGGIMVTFVRIAVVGTIIFLGYRKLLIRKKIKMHNEDLSSITYFRAKG
jgi:oligosaccharide repeat unit polymerase